MFATVLHLLLTALGVTLSIEGLKKNAGTWYARQSLTMRKLLPWVASLLLVLALRAFDLPDTLIGAVYFLGTVAVVALVAQGWFRALERLGTPPATGGA